MPSSALPARTIEDVIRELTKGSGLAYSELDFDQWWKKLVEWPPDVFAVTSVLLAESGAYRLAVSPPREDFLQWGNGGGWLERVTKETAEWHSWIASSYESNFPPSLEAVGALMKAWLHSAAREIAKEGTASFDFCESILTLHALADEASHGLGVPDREQISADEQPLAYMRLRAELRLAAEGTLSFIRTDRIRVLPKLRTPQVGISLRSLSHHLAIQRSEVDVGWSVHPGGMHRLEPGPMRLNLLVFPWPFDVHARDFREVASGPGGDRSRIGGFEYDPRPELDVATEVAAAVESARRVGSIVDGLVMPEAALTDEEYRRVAGVLMNLGVSFFLSGVRGKETNAARLALSFDRKDPVPWHVYEQHKHHRWCMDANQIYQYHLGATLHPSRILWENIQIATRSINFVALNSWLTLCHLICEDLARLDPVSEVVRAVGPNLVIALLLDGPQLEARWPGRYASVLADDPGSSVLTVTSLGLVKRAVSKGHAPSRVVALWKDSRRGAQELALAPDAKALLLTLCGESTQEYTADGRADRGTAGLLVLGGVEQVRWTTPEKINTTAPAHLYQPSERAITALCFLTDALVTAPSHFAELINLARHSSVGDDAAVACLEAVFARHFASETNDKFVKLDTVCNDLKAANPGDAASATALSALSWSMHGRMRGRKARL